MGRDVKGARQQWGEIKWGGLAIGRDSNGAKKQRGEIQYGSRKAYEMPMKSL